VSSATSPVRAQALQEPRVVVGRQSRRQAAGHRDGVHAACQLGRVLEEQGRVARRDVEPALEQLRDLAGALEYRQAHAGLARDGEEGGLDPLAAQAGLDRLPRTPADEAGDHGLVAERREHAGQVDGLAARHGGPLDDAGGTAGLQAVDHVRGVHGGVEADTEAAHGHEPP
jgi:hypothetical protein